MVDPEILEDLYGQRNASELKRFLRKALPDKIFSLQPNWHPLGFIHCKIAESNLDTFRLHIWPIDILPEFSQAHKIHDHLFNVESLVLVGSILCEEYIFLENLSSTATHRIVNVDYSGASPILYESNLTGMLRSSASIITVEGDFYKLPSMVLHESTLSSQRTAITLVRTTNPIEYNPRIILPIEVPLPPPRQPVHFSKNLWLNLLAEFLI